MPRPNILTALVALCFGALTTAIITAAMRRRPSDLNPQPEPPGLA